MARHDFKTTRRSDKPAGRQTRSGGLGSGILIGLVIGLIIAAGAIWWVQRKLHSEPATQTASVDKSATGPIKVRKPTSPEITKPTPPSIDAPISTTPVLAPATVPRVPAPSATTVTRPAPTINAPISKARAPIPAAVTTPAVPAPSLGYHDILTKNATPHPAQPIKPREVWWLQVAALKHEEDARKLRGRLLLLNVDTIVEPYEAGNVLLYRVRVGPYKTEEAALPALEILSHNNLQPRLLKEPIYP